MDAKFTFADASGPGAEHRRSQRILLVIPVEVTWTTSTGMRVHEHAETEVVNAHGALLRIKARLPRGAQVEIARPHTQERAQAKVVCVIEPGSDGLARIGVELAVPGEKFWGISLPPAPAPKP